MCEPSQTPNPKNTAMCKPSEPQKSPAQGASPCPAKCPWPPSPRRRGAPHPGRSSGNDPSWTKLHGCGNCGVGVVQSKRDNTATCYKKQNKKTCVWGVKIRATPKWNPGKWKQGLKPVPGRFNFDPYPHLGIQLVFFLILLMEKKPFGP